MAGIAGLADGLFLGERAGTSAGGCSAGLKSGLQGIGARVELGILRIRQRKSLQQFQIDAAQALPLLVDRWALPGACRRRESCEMKLRQPHDRSRVLVLLRRVASDAVGDEPTQQQA